MRRLFHKYGWLLGVVMLAAFTGCERSTSMPFTAEVDEPHYRRGDQLKRQGRNSEALQAYLKVIEKRGSDAPESHLEVGLIYLQDMRDPLAAIYHFKRFLELKPNSPQSELVRQRIDAATRDFARTLPAQLPDSSIVRSDSPSEIVSRIQRENQQLREEIALLRSGVGSNASSAAATETYRPQPEPTYQPATQPNHATAQNSPITLAPLSEESAGAATVQTPVYNRPTAVQPAQTVQPSQQQPRPATPGQAARTHVVVKGDTLMSLALHYYGNRSRWRDIYQANRDQMPTEHDLKLGMALRIP